MQYNERVIQMRANTINTIFAIILVMIFVGSISVGLSACKKETDKSATTTVADNSTTQKGDTTQTTTAKGKSGSEKSTESGTLSPEVEARLEHDDNVVADPFADDYDTTASKTTTKKSSQTTKKSLSGNTTKKSSSATTTSKKNSGTVTDENGDYWTGWY